MTREEIEKEIAANEAQQQAIKASAERKIAELDSQKHATVNEANLAIGACAGRIEIYTSMLARLGDTTDAPTSDADGGTADDGTTDSGT
jgi:hypothetical protein